LKYIYCDYSIPPLLAQEFYETGFQQEENNFTLVQPDHPAGQGLKLFKGGASPYFLYLVHHFTTMLGITNATYFDNTRIQITSKTLGSSLTMWGSLEYLRIAPKKGLLNGCIHIPPNSSNTFPVTTLDILGNLLGISIKKPSAYYQTGKWSAHGGNNSYLQYCEYGTYVNIYPEGAVQFGRFYYNSDNILTGDWTLSDMSDAHIQFWDVYIEEN